MTSDSRIMNAMSVDVEDYFHVSAFEPFIDRDDWSDYECRIPRNMEGIIELFEASNIKGTFFCLGWVAEKYPSLLRQVADLGHEIASHGYSHIRVSNQSKSQFSQDVQRTKKLLEDITGKPVRGYRAASFSISPKNEWAHDVLADAGHRYSSSIYSIRHDRYSMRDQPRFPFRTGNSGIFELPVTAVEIGRFRLPCGGGGYFRLLPYRWTNWAIRRVNLRDGRPAMFYFHPWELDPDQPRIAGLDKVSRFRHYVNLRHTEDKLRRLLRDFRWGTVFDTYADTLES